MYLSVTNHALTQANLYHKIGQLLAMSVVQGGSGVHALGESVYRYLSATPVSDIIVSITKVPDPEVKKMLEKVCNFHYCTHTNLQI